MVHEIFPISGFVQRRTIRRSLASTAKDFKLDRDVDMDYFWALSEAAREAIEKFGPIEELVKGV